MDFIKTSSLRALIELTFQRKWNGLIWMSRKGVIAKRVKTAPDGHIENQRRTRRPAGRGTNVPRSAKTVFVRLMSRPKSNPSADHTHDPGNMSRGRPSHATPRTTTREPGNASRPRNSSRTTADAVRAGKRPTSGRETIGQISPSTTAGRPIIRPRPFRLGQDPTVRPTSRPTVRTPRSTRSRF
ncbi:unnamed protein product [Microthlaspi erraticum]|uniref:Uncharacterized protein n=1 Tax=Microthlaspi erraticum TaxID=1685480 RepID=A0A6D2JS55_9BRAS|nr:unnamed protein product [Microthlaspi erraticum]